MGYNNRPAACNPRRSVALAWAATEPYDGSAMNRWWLAAAAAACVAMLVFRMAAPSDIFENAQARPCAHIVDVAVHGNWLMQRDPGGLLATKPPMYPWIGAVIVKALGDHTSEWVFKAPLWLAYLGIAVLIVDLGRRSVPGPSGVIVGALAAAMWAANHHTFKLAYTARTDMLLTGFIILAVWAVVRQRQRWLARQPVDRLDVVVFWIAIALGVLTKGPAALFPVGLGLLLLGYDRGWRCARPGWQAGCAVAMLGLAAAWLIPALLAHPQWMDNINREVVERVAGTGTGARRTDGFYVIPYYLLTRTSPWSLIFAAGVGTWWFAWRSRPAQVVSPSLSDTADADVDRAAIGWTLAWVALLLAVFMISKGRRADYLLPAYPPMMIATAWAVLLAQARRGWLRGIVHAVLGCTAVAAIVTAAATPWLPRPLPLDLGPWPQDIEPSYTAVYLLAALLALAGGAAGLWWTHHRRYTVATLAACLGVIGVTTLIYTSFAPQRTDRRSEYAHAVVAIARQASEESRLPIVCHYVGRHGSEIIPALLGQNDPWGRQALERLDDGSVLVVGVKAWERIAADYAGRAVVLARTPVKSYRTGILGFLVVRIDPATTPATAPPALLPASPPSTSG
jgi:4-amino-4-deoxy-L-arabinose transferase-like glycosyltransferase